MNALPAKDCNFIIVGPVLGIKSKISFIIPCLLEFFVAFKQQTNAFNITKAHFH